MKRVTISILAFVALLGCQTTMSRIDKEVGAQQPSEYKEGYAGGCDSGYVAAGHPYYRFKKDVNRYLADAVYKTGWDDGFAVCKSDYESIGRSLRR